MDRATQQLMRALRTWHRHEHGDEVGALEDLEAGVQLPEEWADIFEAQADLTATYENFTSTVEEFGYDSDEADEALQLWVAALNELNESIDAVNEDEDEDEEPPARGRPGPGPGRGQGAPGRGRGAPPGRGSAPGRKGGPVPAAVRSKAQQASMQGYATGPSTSQVSSSGGGGGGGVVQSSKAVDLGSGVTMGPIDIANIRGLPPSMSRS